MRPDPKRAASWPKPWALREHADVVRHRRATTHDLECSSDLPRESVAVSVLGNLPWFGTFMFRLTLLIIARKSARKVSRWGVLTRGSYKMFFMRDDRRCYIVKKCPKGYLICIELCCVTYSRKSRKRISLLRSSGHKPRRRAKVARPDSRDPSLKKASKPPSRQSEVRI